jgi:hypothetical protein
MNSHEYYSERLRRLVARSGVKDVATRLGVSSTAISLTRP